MSRERDQFFGYSIDAVEASLLARARELRPDAGVWGLGQALHDGHQMWVGLDPQTLQTPYEELEEMFRLVPVTELQHVVDLGAGYGRVGVYLHEVAPAVKFTGYEYVPERVVEGLRVFRQRGVAGELSVTDLTDRNFRIPIADIYFLYDFGDVPMIRKILDQMGELSHPFRLIARGKGVRGLVDLEYPWLSDVHEVLRRENFAIYRNFGAV